MISVWQDNSNVPQFEELTKDIRVDVLIIGGGLCGIMCARLFDKAGIDYALVESGRILSGVTANTTAKVTAQHGLIYNKISSKYGRGLAKEYLKANLAAVEEIKDISKNIDCDFENVTSYVFSIDDSKKLDDEINALHNMGYSAELEKNIGLPFENSGAVRFINQGQFNPLKFGAGIVKNFKIYENTKVLDIDKSVVHTNKGKITANKIIVATHFPIIDAHGLYFMKMYQSRSYSIVYENAPDVNGIFVDEYDKGFSFRNYKNMLIICGGDHRTGKRGGCFDQISSLQQKYYPDAVEKYRYATQDCMTSDNIPYIGVYSKHTPNLYVATGFNKWGMTTSAVAAHILFDTVIYGNSEYKELYNPRRSMITPQLFVNAAVSVCDMLFPTVKRCSHLGCALKWNDAEKTWDCPCHGSRFDQDGQVLDNPALKNAKSINKKS